jgi:(1->4)-alpha-D-glucan 1-alpha-D-glucosylmutase
VRARLAVLSEMADEWCVAAARWLERSAAGCTTVENAVMPSAGDRAILPQAIVGAWPLGLRSSDRAGLETYAKRIAAWQLKALREATLHSDWSAPNEAYEQAAADFVA